MVTWCQVLNRYSFSSDLGPFAFLYEFFEFPIWVWFKDLIFLLFLWDNFRTQVSKLLISLIFGVKSEFYLVGFPYFLSASLKVVFSLGCLLMVRIYFSGFKFCGERVELWLRRRIERLLGISDWGIDLLNEKWERKGNRWQGIEGIKKKDLKSSWVCLNWFKYCRCW